MSVILENIERYFQFLEDPKTGDYLRFHLYCYYREGSEELKFHRQWKITGTELALSSNSEALKQQRKEQESWLFQDQIRHQLEQIGKYLVATEERLFLQSST